MGWKSKADTAFTTPIYFSVHLYDNVHLICRTWSDLFTFRMQFKQRWGAIKVNNNSYYYHSSNCDIQVSQLRLIVTVQHIAFS